MSLTGKENAVLYRFTFSKVRSPEELALERAYAELAGTWLLVKVERMGEARNGGKMYMDDGKSSPGDHNHIVKQKLTFSFNRDTNRGSYYRTLNHQNGQSAQHFVYTITSTSPVKSLILDSDDDYTYELFKGRDKQYMYLVKTKRGRGDEMNWTTGKLERETITKQFRFTYEKIEEKF